MAKFAHENSAEIWDEALELMSSNVDETGLFPEKFEPDRMRFAQLEHLKLIRTYTCRVDGVLVGYAIFMISPHMHYPSLTWALQDVLYMSPSYRGRVSLAFIDWQDARLIEEGADIIHRHVSSLLDYSRVLERRGYEQAEIGYVRRP